MSTPPWLAGVEGRVRRWLAGEASRAWVVGVSGGGDSVALLRALHALGPGLGLALAVAHLDHGVRGESARADAAFVTDLARSLGLPVEVGHWSPTRPGHFEADARAARLAFLREAARKLGASAVALGHTRDDQAETVLHRVVRGTGLRGLAGIPPRRALGEGVTLVRPLLDVTRAELQAYLSTLGQPFVTDASNADTTRTRSRVRHEVLPRLRSDLNPQADAALARLAGLARASYAALRRAARSVERAATLGAGPDRLVFDADRLRDAPPALRVEALRLAWQRQNWPERGMTARRWRRLARLAPDGPVDIGAGVVARLDASRLLLDRRPRPAGTRAAETTPDPVPLPIPGAAAWPGGRVVVTLDDREPREESVDLECLRAPLYLRRPEPGDRFEPLGMGGRGQALNDFFRGCRVSPAGRAATPLVCDALGIVWVVGRRIADRVKVTAATRDRAGLRWEADGPA